MTIYFFFSAAKRLISNKTFHANDQLIKIKIGSEEWRFANQMSLQKIKPEQISVLENVDLSSITKIILKSCQITGRTVKRLCVLLKDCPLSQMELDTESFKVSSLHQFTKGNWKNVRSLLIKNLYDIQHAEWIATGKWNKLERLIILREMNNETMDSLCKGGWSQLKYLYIQDGAITDVGMSRLSFCNWNNLTTIIFNLQHYMGFKSVKYVAQGKFPLLQVLAFRDTCIGNEGIRILMKGMRKLMTLAISGSFVSRSGLKYLVKAKFPQLQEMRIGHSEFYWEDMKVLVAGDWSNIKNITIENHEVETRPLYNHIEPLKHFHCAGVQTLRSRFPEARLVFP